LGAGERAGVYLCMHTFQVSVYTYIRVVAFESDLSANLCQLCEAFPSRHSAFNFTHTRKKVEPNRKAQLINRTPFSFNVTKI